MDSGVTFQEYCKLYMIVSIYYCNCYVPKFKFIEKQKLSRQLPCMSGGNLFMHMLLGKTEL